MPGSLRAVPSIPKHTEEWWIPRIRRLAEESSRNRYLQTIGVSIILVDESRSVAEV